MATPALTGTGDDESVQTTLQTNPIQTPAITPEAAANPIKFVAPALTDNGAGNLMALAKGLSQFDAGLGSYFDAQQKQQDDYDKIQAQADFHKNHAVGYQQAVQQGLVPSFASKAYMDAYKETQGSVAGYDLQQKYDAAYQNWDKSGDYGQFLKSFLAQNVATDDPAVLKGLMPHVQQILQAGHGQYISDLDKTTKVDSQNAQAASWSNTLDAAHNQALQTGKPLALDAMWNEILQQRAAWVGVGNDPNIADQTLINTLTTDAVTRRGSEGLAILSLLDRTMPGKTYTLGQTPYGQSQKLQTMNTLETLGRRAVTDAAAAQEKANKAELGDVQSRVLASIAANPSAPIPEELIQQGSKAGLDPEFRVHVAGWQDTLLHNSGASDPQQMLTLNQQILDGGGMEAIRKAMENGVIRNPADLKAVMELDKSVAKTGDLMGPIMKGAQVKNIQDAIKQRTSDKDDLAKLGLNNMGLSDNGLALNYSFQKQLQDWAALHPQANEQEQAEAIAKIGKGVLDQIQQIPFGGAAPITSTPGAPNNPYVSAPVQPSPGTLGAPPAPPQPTPAPAPQQQQQGNAQPDPAKVQAWYNTLTPQQKTALIQGAQQRGLDINQVTSQAYQHSIGGQAGAPVAPLAQGANNQAPQQSQQPSVQDFANGIHQAVQNWHETDPNSPQIVHQLQNSFMAALHNQGAYQGNYTLAAIKDNPKAAHILDFISGPESAGNYNAYYEHAHSSTDLSKMTVDQILNWQQQRTREGSASSATGRYQFMHATLEGLKTQMGLKGSEKFTPILQDQLALQLLKNRGYERWVAGKMSDATFAENLAHEWASLPDLHTGRSVYDGDGLNKSLVTPHQFAGALNTARTLPGETPGK